MMFCPCLTVQRDCWGWANWGTAVTVGEGEGKRRGGGNRGGGGKRRGGWNRGGEGNIAVLAVQSSSASFGNREI